MPPLTGQLRLELTASATEDELASETATQRTTNELTPRMWKSLFADTPLPSAHTTTTRHHIDRDPATTAHKRVTGKVLLPLNFVLYSPDDAQIYAESDNCREIRSGRGGVR